jgi:hypothetical protein
MDKKQIMDKLLADVPEEERKDVVRRLVDAESMDERIEIARAYVGDGVEVADWLSEEFELSDEDLEKIAGGDEVPWYTYGTGPCSA